VALRTKSLKMSIKSSFFRTIRSLQPVMRFPTAAEAVIRHARSVRDSIRYESIALAIATIRREAIPGALAEVGVWRGELSRFLHRCAPERKLYLFDTFAGFPAESVGPLDLQNKDDRGRFRDTSVEQVRKSVGESRNIVFRVGIFPDSAAGLEQESFSLVMLDLDIYAPTLAALEFFYPRVSSGGYIFVHDFNSPESSYAMQRAVLPFLSDKLEKIVELPDEWGSVVIRKI
jgi:O-methyltransferase